MAAGLKASGGLDVALVVNDGPDATAAGVFTANRVKAAPVLWSQQVLRAGIVRAVVLNSGGANACTGPQRLPGHPRHRRARGGGCRGGGGRTRLRRHWMRRAGRRGGLLDRADRRAAADAQAAGRRRAAVRGLTRDGGAAAAQAIMTTDTRPKTATVVAATAGRSAEWPRAPACWPPAWPRCSAC